jgi:hypothetical protein
VAGQTFKCWGCDHSFTDEIKQEWNPPPGSGIELAMFDEELAASPPPAAPVASPPKAVQIRLVLTCDHSPTPHTNVFAVPPAPGVNPVVGVRPTPDDTFWQGSIQQMTPDKSMATLDSQARWIFTSVGVIGTALTGFTILAATRLQAAPWWLTGPTVVLTAASLVLAALALVPDTGQFHAANLTEVQDTWNRDIRTRRWKVRLSSITFAVAIAFAATTALVVNSQPSQDGVTTLQVAGTDASEALSATVTLSSLPAGASISTTVQGSNASGTKMTLFTDNTTADATGSAKVTASVPNVSSFLQFFVTSTVTSNRAVVRTETATLTPSS